MRRKRHKSHYSVSSSTSTLHRNAHADASRGIPHTLHHLGDLIRQQKRKKVLQEQNGQGNFDNLTGHHQQSPGQHRGTTHGSTEGNRDSEKLTFPISIPVIILPANGTVHHEVHLQGVRELGAGSSGRGNTRNDTDRNLLIQPQLALSHTGETNSTSLRGNTGS